MGDLLANNLLRDALCAEKSGDERRAVELLDAAMCDSNLSVNEVHEVADANFRLKRLHKAMAALDTLTKDAAPNAGTYFRKGQILAAAGQRKAALANFERALYIDSRRVEFWTGYGATLSADNQIPESLKAFQHGLAIAPHSPGLMSNCGWLLCQMQKYEEAIAYLNQALEIAPQHAGAKWNRALCLLTMGRFEQGLEDYEARMTIDDARYERLRDYDAPLWRKGEPVAGKRLFLYTDQGHGDTIQFIRLARELCRLDAIPIVEVQPSLVELCRSMDARVQIVAQGEPVPSFDMFCPMPSLPHRLGLTVDTIPARVPYLRADEVKVRSWRDLAAPIKGRMKVGVTWAGNPQHFNDANRSIGFANFLPLMENRSIAFVNLQKDMTPHERETIRQMGVADFSGEFKSFSDTAALIEMLDLVISVDTSVAHLAGALGKPVWILLPFAVDFRWLAHRSDSPWYPTARLFRQKAQGDWSAAINEVRISLAGNLR